MTYVVLYVCHGVQSFITDILLHLCMIFNYVRQYDTSNPKIVAKIIIVHCVLI